MFPVSSGFLSSTAFRSYSESLIQKRQYQPRPTRLFHRGSDYSHPRNPYSHPPGISIHIAPESVFTCPGIRTGRTAGAGLFQGRIRVIRQRRTQCTPLTIGGLRYCCLHLTMYSFSRLQILNDLDKIVSFRVAGRVGDSRSTPGSIRSCSRDIAVEFTP
jgi:hypothetical protein